MARIQKKNPFPLKFTPEEGLTGQLPLLMTAEQIGKVFQPLDGDREGVEDVRAGSYTGRSRNTRGEHNFPLSGNNSQRTYYRSYSEHPETDEQLWSRKYSEASETPGDLMDTFGYPVVKQKYINKSGNETENSGEYQKKEPQHTDDYTYTFVPNEAVVDPDVSLRSVIHQAGGNIPGKVSLSAQQFGQHMKPEILGGHHRLSVLREDFPKAEVPVEFFNHLWEAKSSGRYT